MADRRVVITGLGVVTPIGVNVPTFWDNLICGRCGIRPIANFDTAGYDVRIGGECVDFDPVGVIDKRQIKRMDAHARFGVVAGLEAFDHSGIDRDKIDPTRAGIILGTGMGGLLEMEQQLDRLRNKGPGKVSAFTVPKLMANAGTGHLSIRLGFKGVCTTVATACASAGNALADAFNAIRHGYADIMASGGTEGAFTPLGLAAFAAMKALSTRNDDPPAASRPFDKDRDGFVLAEGAGILILEEMDSAKARGADIFCEIIGAGASSDASDMVHPDPKGGGAILAMKNALADARINPDEIDYINAHATSTPLGDAIESNAVKSVFGRHAYKLAISSTKGATGHLLGATGGMEMIACVKAIRHGILPPTINLDHPGPQCDLDYVPNHARDARVRTIMNNAFGFGGHNVSIIARAV